MSAGENTRNGGRKLGMSPQGGSWLPLAECQRRSRSGGMPSITGSCRAMAAAPSERVSAMKNQNVSELSGDRLISKREAAGLLGVSIRTVERTISHGSISIRKIRGCVRLLLSEVLLFGGIQHPQRQ